MKIWLIFSFSVQLCIRDKFLIKLHNFLDNLGLKECYENNNELLVYTILDPTSSKSPNCSTKPRTVKMCGISIYRTMLCSPCSQVHSSKHKTLTTQSHNYRGVHSIHEYTWVTWLSHVRPPPNPSEVWVNTTVLYSVLYVFIMPLGHIFKINKYKLMTELKNCQYL